MPKRAAIDRVAEPPSSVKRTLRLTILNQLNRVNQSDATDLADVRMCTERLRHACGQPCRRLLCALQDILLIENIEVCQFLSDHPLPMGDLLKSLGLWEHRHKFPNQISGGQQQRCAIGRALVKAPGLLLCDEPTGALDYKTSKEILALFEQVNREYGCTIVIVTHNDAIKRMAHRILRLRDGELVENEINDMPIPASDLVW